MKKLLESLSSPEKIISRMEFMGDSNLVPKESGIYAWYFKEIPPEVPVANCTTHQELTMLYVGICPKRPVSTNKKEPRTLHDRITEHFTGNARGSTLRKTIGCLLECKIGVEFKVGSDGKLNFTKCSEEKLTKWMNKNSFVTWQTCKDPWKYEKEAFSEFVLPLNLQGNKQNNEFYSTLKKIRKNALAKARAGGNYE